jgi:hypothetical protein
MVGQAKPAQARPLPMASHCQASDGTFTQPGGQRSRAAVGPERNDGIAIVCPRVEPQISQQSPHEHNRVGIAQMSPARSNQVALVLIDKVRPSARLALETGDRQRQVLQMHDRSQSHPSSEPSRAPQVNQEVIEYDAMATGKVGGGEVATPQLGHRATIKAPQSHVTSRHASPRFPPLDCIHGCSSSSADDGECTSSGPRVKLFLPFVDDRSIARAPV